jgi:glycosyltransferase involved in cell wall biosynthesis
MIVGIDTYPRMIFTTGVRVVIDNLIASLTQAYPQHRFVELQPSGEAYNNRSIGRTAKAFNHARRIGWTQVALPLAARHAGCDVLLCTCHFSPYIQALPTVTLFYDFAIWRRPDWFPKYWVLMNTVFAQWPARRNTRLITISEDSRQDALRVIKLPADRVTSVPLGVNLPEVTPVNDTEVLASYGIDPALPYVLYCGAVVPHKNVPRLVEAFAQVCQRLPLGQLQLVLAGPRTNAHGRDEMSVVEATIARAGVGDRVRFTGFVPREHCSILYRNAAVFAFPSLFEGFGLPIVEAMRSGAPVVASNCTSLPEVGGDAVMYFDPLDTHSIADALHTVLLDDQLRKHMICAGLERAKTYTWHATATSVMNVLDQARSDHSN